MGGRKSNRWSLLGWFAGVTIGVYVALLGATAMGWL